MLPVLPIVGIIFLVWGIATYAIAMELDFARECGFVPLMLSPTCILIAIECLTGNFSTRETVYSALIVAYVSEIAPYLLMKLWKKRLPTLLLTTS